MPSDKDLVYLAKQGSKGAFDKLVKKYRDQMLALAYDFVNDYELAGDIVQEGFINAYRRIRDFEERAKFSSWLYRIVVNAALDALRKKRQLSAATDVNDINPDDLPAVTSPFAGDGPDDLLLTAIKTLTENQQTAIILRYFHDKDIYEIAEILACSESTVRVHLHRAIRNLGDSITRNK